MERPDISPAVCSLLQYSQFTTASVKRSFSMARKLLVKKRKGRKFETVHDFTFQFSHLVIAELAAYIRRVYCKFC